MSEFSAEEREAMKERAAEAKRSKKRRTAAERAAEEAAVALEKLEEMPPEDREIGMGIHQIIAEVAPQLAPKTWYGMPAYALNGKVICFFQASSKFKVRYSTFGFNEDALLDDGNLWATSFAITKLDEAGRAQIAELVARAVGKR